MGTQGADNFVPPRVTESENERTFSDEASVNRNLYDEFLIPEDSLYMGYDASIDSEFLSFEEAQRDKGSNVFYSFYAENEKEGEELEEEEETSLDESPTSSVKEKKTLESKPLAANVETRRRSLFVHSSPTNFPDINNARKSVFGSIFLRTPADVAEEAALLKTVVESSYTMLQALLNSLEKTLSDPLLNRESRKNTLSFKNSIQKALENHGICKTYADGSVHWYIYPITQNYLFTLRIGDNYHQTRSLSKIEDRILASSAKKLEPPYCWPTGSSWCGHWNALGMAASGTYKMPHGVSYDGKMQNGMFHDDDATLTYPNKFRAVHCVYDNGKMLDCQFQFPDGLLHKKQNWEYCQFPDRRFWSEVQNGLKPAKIAQKSQIDPPKRIPPGAYGTGDGFYFPKSLKLVSTCGEFLRVPVCEEDIWIKKYCRKGYTQPADFRPDLFENWFNYDYELIQSILDMQARFRTGMISYDELQQFYADLGLLPSCSSYKKRKSPSEIALEEHNKAVPDPVPLKKVRPVKKYFGHKLLEEVITASYEESLRSNMEQSSKFGHSTFSKSLLKAPKESKLKGVTSQSGIDAKSSKISFNLDRDLSDSYVIDDSNPSFQKKSIPAKYLAYQPFWKLPFEAKPESHFRTSSSRRKKCLRKTSTESFYAEYLGPEDSQYDLDFFRMRHLEKFMKTIILEIVTGILIDERERHRKRLIWASEFPKKDFESAVGVNKKCMKILEELFESIPEKEEFCDSFNKCDLRQLAEDKHNELKFWGRRIFYLDFTGDSEE